MNTKKTSLILTIIMSGLGLFLLNTVFPVLPVNNSISNFILNLLPITSVAVVFWVMSGGKKITSFLFAIALFGMFFFTNEVKIANLDQPLLAVDFVALIDMSQHASLLRQYFVLTPQLIMLMSVLCFAILLWYFERPCFTMRLRSRLILGSSLSASIFLLMVSGGLSALYQPGKDWEPWQPINNLKNYGLLYSLVHDSVVVASSLPEYDHKRLQTVLHKPSTRLFSIEDSLPPIQQIIIILSESFFDPSKLNHIQSEKFDLANFIALKQRSLTGDIIVPTYGGGTLRTEFELLTGINLQLFPKHFYPFLSLISTDINSIAWDFKRAGYSTMGIHPNIARFWNRDQVYPLLGFDQFIDIDQFENAKLSGYYIADSELTTKIIAELNTTKEKQFIFAISMENHGPWNTIRPNVDHAQVKQFDVPKQLVGESRLALQQYLYHYQRAEHALLTLIQMLHQRDDRSVVLFFGDHLPGLNQTFKDLAFKDGRSKHKQTTPFLIYDTHRNLANFGLSGYTIDVELLGSILLDLSMDSLSQFHLQAERLHLRDRAKAKHGTQYSDLEQLQLWRFWEKPSI